MTGNTEKDQNKGWLISSIVTLVLGIIGLLNLIMIELVIVPKFKTMFSDLGNSLTALTRIIINTNLGYSITTLAIISLAGLIIKEIKIKEKKKCFFINLGFLILTWIIIFLYVTTFYLALA